MPQQQQRKAVFLDRDGTLIEEVNFLSRVDEMKLFSYTKDSLQDLKSAGFCLFVITNQSGIARGYFDKSAVHAIHEKLQEEVGGIFDGFFHCPHLPDAGCRCRKPSPGMIIDAATQFDIDLAASWMIGDKTLDIETGRSAGTKSVLVQTGYGERAINALSFQPDLVSKDLGEAVQEILRRAGSASFPTSAVSRQT